MKIKSNILANFFGSGWNAVMGFAFVPIYIRYLGMEAYSLVGIFTIMQAWLSMLDMGMTPTLNREMARYTAGDHSPQSIWDLLRSLEIVAGFVFIFISLLVFSFSTFLATRWLKVENLPLPLIAQALSISGVVIGLRFIEGIYRSCLFGLEKQVWYNIANSLLVALRWAGVIIILHFVSNTIQAFFIWQALVSITALLVFSSKIYSVLEKAPKRPRFSASAIKKVWAFASGMLFITFLTLLLTQIDKILLSKMLPLKEFGYYALATTIVGFIGLATTPITQAVYPRMVIFVSQKKERELITLYHACAQLISILTGPVLMLFAFFSYEIVYVWSKDLEIARNVSYLLMPLAIGTFLNIIMWVPYQLQLAHGWTSFTLKVNIVAVLVFAPSIFFVVPHFGAVGAAWTWALLNGGYVFIAIPIMHRYLLHHEKWRWYLSDVFVPILFSGLVAFLFKKIEPDLTDHRFLSILWLAMTGAVCFATALLAAKDLRQRTKVLITSFFYT